MHTALGNSVEQQDQIITEEPMHNNNSNVNLEHLLRATNHLKIAQNEFELAKR